MNIESIDHEHAVATSEALMLCIWRKATTHEAVLELHGVSTGLARRAPGKIGFLTVVEPTADMVSGPVRSELAKMFRGVANAVSCSALVFEGEGFQAAAARAVTTTINQLARQPFPHRVFGDVQAAVLWMETHDGRFRPRDLHRNVEQIRDALDNAARASVS
ncbi:MAG: hypothetical protein AB8I08_09405 [Sandaracinaceae bacterium]